MTLTEAIESKRGLPYAQALTELRSETVSTIGSIKGDNLRDVVAVLAGGLKHRLETAAVSALRTALLTGFEYMGLPDYAFNLAAPDVSGLMSMGVSAGLILPEEHARFIALATYQKPVWPTVTLHDVVAHFEPALVDVGDWLTVDNVASNRLQLRTTVAMPEPTMVSVEMSESEDGVNWTEYKRVNHFYNVHKADFYFAAIPNNGLQRKFRVRGEIYRLTGTVKAV
jgi:hypothetical protein